MVYYNRIDVSEGKWSIKMEQLLQKSVLFATIGNF